MPGRWHYPLTMEHCFQFSYRVLDSSSDLDEADRVLLQRARVATAQAYAPYSHFRVGAAARLVNGVEVAGANQENAAFPAGLCAERVLLASISSQFPNMAVETIALSYDGQNVRSAHPITPCGICRQSLQEYEARTGHAIRLLLAGATGPVFVIESAGQLLPLAFTGAEL